MPGDSEDQQEASSFVAEWSRGRVVADEVSEVRERVGWGFGRYYKDFGFPGNK